MCIYMSNRYYLYILYTAVLPRRGAFISLSELILKIYLLGCISLRSCSCRLKKVVYMCFHPASVTLRETKPWITVPRAGPCLPRSGLIRRGNAGRHHYTLPHYHSTTLILSEGQGHYSMKNLHS